MKNETVQILVLSNVGFNPCFDHSIVKWLIEKPIDEWQDIFEHSEYKNPGTLGEDTDYALLVHALQKISLLEEITSVQVVGTLFSAEFERSYKIARDEEYRMSFQEFSQKAMTFINHIFHWFLRDIPVHGLLMRNTGCDTTYENFTPVDGTHPRFHIEHIDPFSSCAMKCESYELDLNDMALRWKKVIAPTLYRLEAVATEEVDMLQNLPEKEWEMPQIEPAPIKLPDSYRSM